jgi:D-3-phosphoglycerate dehydrogenase
VLYAPGRNAVAVAEDALAGLLALMRRMPAAIDCVRRGEWRTAREDTFEKPSGPELAGKRAGVIGFGRVGRRVARLLAAFGAEVMVRDPHVAARAIAAEGHRAVALDELIATAQVIAVHARLPNDAAPILGAREFARMRAAPYLVNAARANALDHAALIDALAAGRVAGALLDVHPEEPLPRDSPFLRVDPARLLLTPHVAGVSSDVPAATARLLADGVAALLRGERPEFVMNPEALPEAEARLKRLPGAAE